MAVHTYNPIDTELKENVKDLPHSRCCCVYPWVMAGLKKRGGPKFAQGTFRGAKILFEQIKVVE